MINIIIGLLLIALGISMAFIEFHAMGYNKREQEFQNKPIVFFEDGEKAVKVWRDASSNRIIIDDFRTKR